jgi:type IV pilus assembly protein PilC
MPHFRYTARNAKGHIVSGIQEASSPEVLVDQLKRSGLVVTGIRAQAHGSTQAHTLDWRRVSQDELLLFSMELSKLVEVGIPLLTALRTLAEQAQRTLWRRVIADIASSIETGSSFSESLLRHPRVFSGIFVSLVKAGEASGKLDEVLRRLSDFARQRASINQQLVTALVYPCFLLVFGVGIMIFLVTSVIPKFMALFLEAGVPLPLPTRLLYELSQALHEQGFWIIIALVALVVLIIGYCRTPAGKWQIDATVLRLPVIGALVRQIVLSRLSRTFETLVASGVPMLDALSILEHTSGNQVIGRVVQSVHASVKEGGAISDPLRQSREIPPMMTQMIVVGETSGTLDQMLRHLADYWDERVQHDIKRVTAFIEPVLLIIMGGMVAFIMASLLLPLFKLVSLAQ